MEYRSSHITCGLSFFGLNGLYFLGVCAIDYLQTRKFSIWHNLSLPNKERPIHLYIDRLTIEDVVFFSIFEINKGMQIVSNLKDKEQAIGWGDVPRSELVSNTIPLLMNNKLTV